MNAERAGRDSPAARYADSPASGNGIYRLLPLTASQLAAAASAAAAFTGQEPARPSADNALIRAADVFRGVGMPVPGTVLCLSPSHW